MRRRQVLKAAVASIAAAAPAFGGTKKVIIAGGGIAGLSCAWELLRRGHDPVVLEAAGRPGGHVLTIHDPFADGLYADVGAEHFTRPGYDLYWDYVREFNLPYLRYPRRDNVLRVVRGKLYSEEMLADPAVLKGFGLNQREIEFLRHRAWWDLQTLYFKPYMDSFGDEYQPFKAGLNDLDKITATDLLRKDGASPAAIGFIGNSDSALYAVWHDAIMKIRGIPLRCRDLFRLEGGNQRLTDTFAAKLGERVRLGCPVTKILRSDTGVKVEYKEYGQTRSMEADYLVCCMSAVMLRQIPVTPDWPGGLKYAIENIPYYSAARVVFQSRTRFWKEDAVSPNMFLGAPNLHTVWAMADEVRTPRGLLIGTAEPGARAPRALEAFRKSYPGSKENIEQSMVWDWSRDPWAMACETIALRPGELPRIWPHVTRPCGRVYFAGAYCDNLNRGQESATRSAKRVVDDINARG